MVPIRLRQADEGKVLGRGADLSPKEQEFQNKSQSISQSGATGDFCGRGSTDETLSNYKNTFPVPFGVP